MLALSAFSSFASLMLTHMPSVVSIAHAALDGWGTGTLWGQGTLTWGTGTL